ncbi:caspase Dronc [Odontomachus brunneus]|uniref:caspase Dronc n=1 Tax=Odontomachus brunneus TaxID=486640 RepID=UPI0013F27E9D|nr:caspase Dronc [Odontomachus brunneus]XP_032683335.1 caspase Dronc [Odontomachus brunneus]
MEQKHRDIIDIYSDKIVQRIDMLKLFPKLLEHRIYNPDDVNIPKWIGNLTAQGTAKDIFLRIKTRGPKAFERLLLSLRQIGDEDVADILDGKIQQKSNNDRNDRVQHLKEENPPQEYFFYRDIQQSDEPLKIKLRKATEFLDNCDSDIISRYPMRSNPRGLVLLITNIDYKWSKEEHSRLSAQHDEENLKELFEKMGFQVISKQNLTGKVIKDVVREFSKRSDLSNVDSCFVIISSHGTQNKEHHSEIQGVDYGKEDSEGVVCNDILEYFSVDACPQMANKPKIFIFQLCRGYREQNAIHHERLVTDTYAVFHKDEEVKSDDKIVSDKFLIRNYADMLIVHSTLPGHVAYRDTTTGSWFIQILCSVFMTLAYKHHVQDLFSIIDSELQHLRTRKDNCQTSSVKSIGFNRHCYLNPGYFPN